MQLIYYHAIFEISGLECPAEIWEAILAKLKVVLSIYGQDTMDDENTHQMHCIFEDDKSSRSYNQLPEEYRNKAKYFMKVKHVRSHLVHLKIVLHDEPDLTIVDNTHSY